MREPPRPKRRAAGRQVALLLAGALVAALTAAASPAGPVWTPLTAQLAGRATGIVASPVYSFDGVLWLATDAGGILHSQDRGRTFQPAAAGLRGRAVRALAASPRMHLDGVVLAGTDDGLVRSIDRGLTWSAAAGIPSARVAGVAFSPKFAADGLSYAVVVGHGLYRSFDLGQTWTRFAAAGLTDRAFRGLTAVDGKDAQTHLAVWTRDVVYLSNNSGSIFNDISTDRGLPVGTVIETVALAPDFQSSLTLWVGARADGLYRSTSAGAAYARVLPASVGSARAVAFSPVYARDGFMLAGTSGGGVYRSATPADPGATWSPQNVNLAFADVAGLAFSNDFYLDRTVFAAGTSGRMAFSSTAGDDWWTNPLALTSARVAALSVPAAGVVVAGTPLGVHVQANRAAAWVTRNRDLPSARVLAGAAAPDFSTSGIALVGVAGEGVYRTVSAGQYWVRSDAGLPAATRRSLQAVVFSPALALDNTVFVGGPGGVFRSRTGGSTWEALNSGIASPETVLALAISPRYASDGTLIVGTAASGIYRSTDGGQSWALANSGLTSLNVRSVAIGADGAFVIAATRGGVFVSHDAARSWTSVPGLGAATAVAISGVVGTDPTAFVALEGPDPRVLQSTDGGQTWRDLAPLVGATGVLGLVRDPGSTPRLLAATSDAGIWAIDLAVP